MKLSTYIRPALLSLPFLFHASIRSEAQDTFSIVAVDSATGAVGSAGASCISADNLQLFFPGIAPDFLGDLLPGRGAINSQSFYLEVNQQNARTRLAMGDTPQEVVDWLAANDAQGNSSQRQYGVAALGNGSTQAAAFTGANCFDWKGHRVGQDYAIQGNILLGASILDSMEANYLATNGCLADKLMAAMRGAKVPGADTRCLVNGTSAMFAFLKVAYPDDDPTQPALRLFVSYNPTGIEPIDSLQALFELAAPCVNASNSPARHLPFSVTPNPASGQVRLVFDTSVGPVRADLFDLQGRLMSTHPDRRPADTIPLPTYDGMLLLRLTDQSGRTGSMPLLVR
jgi:uncharacterized Ntn-hydrolase superfamily protein